MPQDDQAEADQLDDELPGSDHDAGHEHDPDLGATDLDSYRELVDNLQNGQAQAVEEESASEDANDEDSGEEGAESEESEEGSEAEDGEESDEDEEEEAVEEEAEESAAQTRFRIRAADKVEATALDLRKRNPEWSLETCLAKAKLVHGEEPAQEADEAQDAGLPKTVSDTKAKIRELLAKKAEAFENLDYAEGARFESEIEDLRDHMDALRVNEVEHETVQQHAYQEAVQRSQKKAVAIYPDTTDANSALVKRMEEIDRQMKADENPLYYSPEKSFKLAQMAANDLGIAPRNPQKAAAKPPGKKANASRPIQPASGSARTATPASASTKLESAIDGIQSMDDYETMVESLGVTGD